MEERSKSQEKEILIEEVVRVRFSLPSQVNKLNKDIMKKFDLASALSGGKLVTRSGLEVNNFKEVDDSVGSDYPFEAKISGYTCTFTKSGLNLDYTESKDDLFMAEEVWVPKYGEKVLVRSYDNTPWRPRIYIGSKDDLIHAVTEKHERWFNITGAPFEVSQWKQIKKPEKVNIVITINGKEVTKEEALKALQDTN